jgi:AmmeMemoRadiSam system protein A
MTDLSSADKRLLFDIVRESIRTEGECLEACRRKISPSSPLMEKQSVFVTLTRGGKLRGCIGHLRTDWPLWEVAGRMGCQAAYMDPRFDPVSPDEMPDLEIEISILTSAQPVGSLEEIEAGRDGLIVEGNGRRGLLLPQVAVHRGWDKTTFLEQTCLKAGLAPDAWKSDSVQISRFQAVVLNERELIEHRELPPAAGA